MTYVLFVIGFIILIKGADLLVDGSSSVAKKMKISSLVIGLTIVSFGTSAPELIVNIFASYQGNTDIAIGNILGSNIANILLILGISAIIYPLVAQKNTVWKEIPLSLLAAVVLAVLVNDVRIDGTGFPGLGRGDGLILIFFFIIFLYYIYGICRTCNDSECDDGVKILSSAKSTVYILLGLFGLVLGGKWIVDGAVKIAEIFDVSQALIGLTVVAIGTSLPELATSAVAAYKKQTDIAIGNVVGSNIFNIFWILGCSALIRPLPFSSGSDVDILMVLISSLLLFSILFVGKRHTITRADGVLMVFTYVIYLVFLVVNK